MKCVPRHIRLATVCAAVLTACSLRWCTAEDERIDRRGAEQQETTGRRMPPRREDQNSGDENSDVEASDESLSGKKASGHGKKAELEDVMKFAQDAYTRIDAEIDDYACLLIRRERVDGKDRGWQFMEAKIRHERKDEDKVTVPFSVYLRFLQPRSVAGREVLYVQNQNHGDLIARRGGTRSPNVTVQLIPTSPLAMEGNRYPITEIGFQTLAKRLIEVLSQELEYRDGDLRVFENAKVGDRQCTHYRLTHHKRRPNLTYHMAEVSVDDELGVPIFYRAYDWPTTDGGKPVLLEQYIYKDIRINIGLTDEDFDPKNPEYHFSLHDENEDQGEEQVTKD